MTTELHERLAGLASVTPATSPPPDLWARGVRRRRVVAAGRTAVVAVLVLMVGLGGWAWHQTRPVEPADTHGTPHLPDRFYTPSPWLPSFDTATDLPSWAAGRRDPSSPWASRSGRLSSTPVRRSTA